MSSVGVQVTREGPGFALPSALAGTPGVPNGDDGVDWEDGGGGPGSIPGADCCPDDDLVIVPVSGPTVEIDYALARTWDVTETEDVTYTIVNLPADQSLGKLTLIRRGGTGPPFTETWPAEVDWDDPANRGYGGGPAPDPPEEGQQLAVEFATETGGASIGGSYEPDPTDPVVDLDDLTDVTLTAPADGDVLTYNGSAWVNEAPSASSSSGEILISDTPSTPLVFADLLQNEAQDDLVYAD